MKKLALAASLILTAQSYAIMGFGVHIAPNSGAEAKGTQNQMIYGMNEDNGLFLDRSDVNSLSGFGVKFWLDFIPKIDIEGTANFQFRTYSSSLYLKQNKAEVAGTRVDLSYDPEFPGASVKAKPALALGTGDLTVLYPFFKPSFVVGYFQVHAGAGLNYTYQSKLVDQATLAKLAETNLGKNPNAETLDTFQDPVAMAELGKGLATEMAKEGYDKGFGGHLVVGARAKLLMFAIYANEKYYIGGIKDPLKSGFVTELGAGFAF